jgi:uncharacterized protein (DUF1697 family)
MTTYISFLRGINIGGNRKVNMEDLRKAYESLKFSSVKTYGLSGNVVFMSSESKIDTLTKKIESKLNKIIGFDLTVLIRTKEELEKIIKNNPFSNLSIGEKSKVAVSFLSHVPETDGIGEIEKIKDKYEQFVINGREIYLYFPNGYGRTKLNSNFFDKKLNVRSTARTFGVINKLLNIAGDIEKYNY